MPNFNTSDIENGASQEVKLRARYRVGVVAQYSLPAANESIVLRVVSPEGGEPQPGSQYIVEFCQAETGAVQEALDAEEGRRFDPASILRVMDDLAEDYLQSVAADWETYVAQSGRGAPAEAEQTARGGVVRDCALVERINASDVVLVVENQVKIEQKAKLRSGSSGPGF